MALPTFAPTSEGSRAAWLAVCLSLTVEHVAADLATLAQVAKLSVLVQAVAAPADKEDDDDGSDGAVVASVPPCGKRAISADTPAAGAGNETTSRKQRIRMGRRLEGAIANRRADAKLPGAARLRRNWFCGVVSMPDMRPHMCIASGWRCPAPSPTTDCAASVPSTLHACCQC